jgi:hypothetical protein
MRKRWGWLLLFIIGFSLLMAGCTDELGVVDLSGEIPLAMSNAGWGYRIIAQTDPTRYNVSPSSRLYEIRNDLALDQTLRIGKTDYLFVSRFQGGFSPFANFHYIESNDFPGFQTQLYNYNTHRRVKFFVMKQSDTGDDWNNRLDNGNDQERHYLSRSGEFKITFFDADTGCDYIVSSTYEVNSVADRETDKKGNFVLDDRGYYEYDSLSLKGKSQICIGTRQCLYAEKMAGTKKIGFYILDWNLDGQFTEDDRVYCNYHDNFFQFNQTIRLTDSYDAKKDNKYVLKLVKPTATNGNFRLLVELVELGVREKS